MTRTRRVIAPLVLGLLVLTGWAVAATRMPATLLPSPAAVAARLLDDLSTGVLLRPALTTVEEAALGALLAACAGIPLGYGIAKSPFADAALSPYLAASQAIPAVAIAPLLVIWVGYGLLPIVLLCALIVVFPIALATCLGIRTLEPDVVEAAQLDGATGARLARAIELPLALPAILTGLRNGFTLAVTGAVVGEFVMGGEGLGMILSSQTNTVDTTGVFATLALLCVLAVLLNLSVAAVDRALSPERRSKGHLR